MKEKHKDTSCTPPRYPKKRYVKPQIVAEELFEMMTLICQPKDECAKLELPLSG